MVLKNIKHLLSAIEEENQGPPSALQNSLKDPKLLMPRDHRPAIKVERLSQPKPIHLVVAASVNKSLVGSEKESSCAMSSR